MSYDNVKLWFAKNKDGSIITIDDISEENKKSTYSCPMCGSNLKPKAVESNQITSHFAHVDASKCASESAVHFWFKHSFIVKGDVLIIVSDKERQYVCKDVLVEQIYEVDGKIYKPDVTIITECGSTIYFEMAFSNKKKVQDYIDVWLELKNIVVEVDIKQLINKDTVPTFKALFYDGKCFNTRKNDTYYNIIGKYKEDKLNNYVSQELKERIQKLDWFWSDIIKYKTGKVSIDQIIELIDSIDGFEKELIVTILGSGSCTKLYDELIFNRIKLIENVIKETIMDFNIGDDISNSDKSIKIEKIYKNTSVYRGVVDFTILEYHKANFNMIKINSQDIRTKIRKIVIWILKGKQCDLIRSNDNIKEAIEHIEEKYEGMFNFSKRFYCGEPNIEISRFDSKSCQRLTVDMSEKEIMFSYDKDTIITFVLNHIEDFKNKNTPINNKKEIIDMLTKLENKYNRINENFFECEFIYDNEVRMQIDNFYPKVYKTFRLLNNKLYYDESKELKFINDINDVSLLQNILLREITNEIYKEEKELSLKCKGCGENFTFERKEMEFFNKKGFDFPQRCKCCREKRKQNKSN